LNVPPLAQHHHADDAVDRTFAAVLERLVRDNPTVADFRRTLGGLLTQEGFLSCDEGQRADATRFLSEGRGQFDAVLAVNPADWSAREGLRLLRQAEEATMAAPRRPDR
jgi:hypothetical protein